MVVDSNGWSVNEGKPIDNFVNEHYSDYTSVLVSNEGYLRSEYYIEYRSYKQYKKLNGTISPYEGIETGTVRIILDDKPKDIYEIGKKTDPIDFEFDISDVDYIRFEVEVPAGSGVIISDVTVSK